ncbi:hypothetical protein K2173_001154 [Erythroxylum novogranatense]|uniref:(S)-hydroxynitrile lyase n=1 Tax=Erythroxylum novogranatense TaxID=1862640 RepID=A0AAV8TL01_9ROSI|nr:hypothetical protein K2173_001154 [Erythroxylum novogranatense]
MSLEKRYMLFISLICISFIFTANGTLSETPKSAPSKHFVLVHGACHGAWSWFKLVPLLKSSGHNVTALDLGASGVDPRQAMDLRSISDYFQPLRHFMASLPHHERVILVGHSYGGLAISQAMEYFPDKVSVAVFISALMPGPALNISTINQEIRRRAVPELDDKYTFANGTSNAPATFTFGPLELATKLYQLSSAEDLTLATMLMRPLPLFTEADISNELRLSKQNYSSVKRVFIVLEYDLIYQKDFQLWMIKKNPPNEVKLVLSDHMVIVSHTKMLLPHLLDVAKKYG